MNQIITKPLTLSGRYFTKKELAYVQETALTFYGLSRTELAETICDYLDWTTARGSNKVNACLVALEKLDKLDLIQLKPKRKQKKRVSKQVLWTDHSLPQEPVECPLSEVGTISLQLVTKEQVDLWNEFVDRYHYLHYRHPIGAALKYFIVSADGRKLGCLLFSASTWHLADRDHWIGWTKKDREKRLNLVINNSRFLIFPWVKVPNLASHALSKVTQQICDDWQHVHHYRPVLIETFVDTTRYTGTCYRSANWECIGETSGKDWKEDSNNTNGTVKSILVKPLQPNFRAVLKNIKKPDKDDVVIDKQFIALWGKVVGIISDVARAFDASWQKRKRVIDSLLLVFLIFRLVFSKNSEGYGTVINTFWHSCHRMKFPLPQKKPISASSFSDARKKLDEDIFKVLNQQIIEACDSDDEETETPERHRWLGHRLFAVDGSKLNLPRELIGLGYKTPSDTSAYPQGLLSCLYQLKPKIPHDFDLVSHGNERRCALAHLNRLNTDDVVVYDRGYFSYAMLYYHIQRGIHPIFRLQKNTFKEIEAFRNSSETDQIIELLPTQSTQADIKRKHPDIAIVPLTFRLVKYTVAGVTYCIGTTLTDSRYHREDFSPVYHSRWGIEELYKISKQMIEVDDFHGRCERTVKQELFAHFVLITMSRLCSNESESLLISLLNQSQDDNEERPSLQVNFKNTLATLSARMEEILLAPAQCIKGIMEDVICSLSHNRQKIRPGRSYERKSMKPIAKWQTSK